MALRIAIFGQAAFGADVLTRILEDGHDVVGAHVPPDRGRPDPLAEAAEANGVPLIRHRYFRRKGGAAIPSRIDEVRAWGADLHLMPYTTVILPPEIVDLPAHGSLCFHPSLLPRFRGGSAIPWQLILDEQETGVTVFKPDAGVDTGPIAVQKGGVPIEDRDTAATLYFQKLYPLGVEAVIEAARAVADGSVRYVPQDEAHATFQGLVDDGVAAVDWERPAREIFCRVRGCDPNPGARAALDGASVRLFDARLEPAAGDAAPGSVLAIEEGRLRVALRDATLSLGKLRVGDAKKVPAPEAGIPAGARLANG